MNILFELEKIFRDIFDDKDLELTPNTDSQDIPDWDSLSQIVLIEEITGNKNTCFVNSDRMKQQHKY